MAPRHHSLFGAASASKPSRPAIVGPISAQGRNMVDAAGPRLRLGVTWFWGPWAVDHDLARFDRNAKTLSALGDFSPRMFGQVVNGGNYVHRQVTIGGLCRAMTRLRDEYRLRSLPVILGDCSDIDAVHKHDQVMTFVDMLFADKSLLNAILMAEIGNEGGHTGLQDIGFLGELYRMVQSAFPSLLVAPTSAEDYPWPDESGGQISDLYARTGASALSAHPSRGGSVPQIIRQMYAYNFFTVPRVGGATEPWGIASSITSTASFDELAASKVVDWVSGWALSVLHVGTGVYGIRESLPYGERYENFNEDPVFMDIAPKLETLRAALPQDLPNFGAPHHADPKFNGTFPFVTLPNQSWDAENKAYGMRAYANVSPDGRFVIVLLDQRRDFTITAARNMTTTVRQMDWEKRTNTFGLSAGEPFVLKTPPSGYGIIEGRFA